jgi:HK97 family phage portal protein
MGLGKLLERNLTYDVTNTATGGQETFTLITDGGPGMYAGWGDGPYRGGMGIPAAWRLALLVANQLGRVPWDSYRKMSDRPPVQLPDQPFLTMPAGTTDTKLSVFRSWGLDRLWHGNAIGVVAARSPLGYPIAATPVDAENVQVQRFGIQLPYPGQNYIPPGFETGEVGYLIGGIWFHARDIVHFKGPCKPGALRGMGVLEAHFDLMSRSRKLGAAATAVDAGAVPTGLLRSLNPDMSSTEAQELKDSWKASQRERTVAVLNPLTEFTPIAWNPTETQLLESRQYDVIDWANVFGVSASYAGGTNPSRVYANIEDQGLDLLRYGTPGDIISEFEEVLSMLMPRGQYVKANLDHVLRADTKSRYEAHSIAIASGFLTRNEVRELEERQPLTPEQEQEVAEATAPVPAAGPSGATGPTGGPNTASNQAGTGKAKPRLAAVRAAFERGRHSAFDPDQPRDPDGQWSDGGGGSGTNMLGMSTGGPGRRRQPATAASSAPSDDDDDHHGDDGEKPGDVTSGAQRRARAGDLPPATCCSRWPPCSTCWCRTSTTADDWGYAERPIRGSTVVSNHASGTAIDLNATCWTLGQPASVNLDRGRSPRSARSWPPRGGRRALGRGLHGPQGPDALRDQQRPHRGRLRPRAGGAARPLRQTLGPSRRMTT